MRPIVNEITVNVTMERRGIALAPSGDELDIEGVLNPASARTRDGKLLLYPRMVAEGNISRIGIYELDAKGAFVRHSIALEPTMSYETRKSAGGHGCEDARVTFIKALDRYVMSYTAFSAQGPRNAIAISDDGYIWTRLGCVNFEKTEFDGCYDKDAAFFPEPIFSPDGVESLTMYHRPTVERDGVLHEDVRLAYIPLAPILENIKNILNVSSSVCILRAGAPWAYVKVGGGTPPIATPLGWLSLYHGVDRISGETFGKTGLTYRAGLLIHDTQSPHYIRYRSPSPVLAPENDAERFGMVDSVVFPTAIDTYDMPVGTAVVYYGMADSKIGAALLTVQMPGDNG
jgi:predicted GH43/DUF377 family glycosyl hydrolase